MADIDTLREVFKWTFFVAAFFATAFPILYLFAPWYRTWLGRILVLHGFAFALALDLTLVLRYWWDPSTETILRVEIIVFGLIAFANALMTYWLWRLNFSKRPLTKANGDRRSE